MDNSPKQELQPDYAVARRIHETDIINGAVSQTKLKTGLYAVNFIKDAALPKTPTTFFVCFAYDSGYLYLYNGTKWLKVQLS